MMNEKEFGEYIKKLRIESGFSSQRQLAEACGLSNGTIARIENGTQKPTPDTLLTLATHLRGTDYLELLLRAGYITREEQMDIDSLRYQYTQNPRLKLAHDSYLYTKESEAKYYKTIKAPILGHIAAGQPVFADEHIEEWTEIPNLWNLKEGEVFLLRVKGDSMIGSRIYDGDLVVVRCQPDVESGEIAVVNVNGHDATLKRVKKTENGQVILYPDNPKYDPIFIENENARIVGKVIQVMFEPTKNL